MHGTAKRDCLSGFGPGRRHIEMVVVERVKHTDRSDDREFFEVFYEEVIAVVTRVESDVAEIDASIAEISKTGAVGKEEFNHATTQLVAAKSALAAAESAAVAAREQLAQTDPLEQGPDCRLWPAGAGRRSPGGSGAASSSWASPATTWPACSTSWACSTSAPGSSG